MIPQNILFHPVSYATEHKSQVHSLWIEIQSANRTPQEAKEYRRIKQNKLKQNRISIHYVRVWGYKEMEKLWLSQGIHADIAQVLFMMIKEKEDHRHFQKNAGSANG